ncbi:MAG: hypothetical protein AAFR70_11315 [Pseudomonadota bacterium]
MLFDLPLRFGFLLLTGLLIGVAAWHFEPASLSFAAPSTRSLDHFPLNSFVPGLALGLALATIYQWKWRDVVRRLYVYTLRAFSGVEWIFVGLACLSILFFL